MNGVITWLMELEKIIGSGSYVRYNEWYFMKTGIQYDEHFQKISYH